MEESALERLRKKTIPFNFTILLPEEVSKVKDITFNSEIIADLQSILY